MIGILLVKVRAYLKLKLEGAAKSAACAVGGTADSVDYGYLICRSSDNIRCRDAACSLEIKSIIACHLECEVRLEGKYFPSVCYVVAVNNHSCTELLFKHEGV